MVTVLKRILYTTLVLLTAACSTSEDDSSQVGGGSVTVAFDAKMGSGITTRTSDNINIIDNIEALKTADKGFGVFACYTGLHKYEDSNVHPDFMYNEHVTWNSTNNVWEYTPLKYWPNGEGEVAGLTGVYPHYVSFMAYAPYSDTHTDAPGYCISSFSLQGEVGNPWLTYRLHSDVTKQVDLLYATQLDQKKPTIAYRVPFVFNHALACVGDQVTIECSTGLVNQLRSRVIGTTTNARVEVTGFTIEYTLTSKARLVLWNSGGANWHTILSEDPICTRTVTLINPKDPNDKKTVEAYANEIPSGLSSEIKKTWEGQGVFYIPIESFGYSQTAKVTITYHIATYNGSKWVNDADNTGTATIVLHDEQYKEAYQPGKHLYINVILNQMDIALKAAIYPWVTEDPVEMEGIEE